MFINQFIKIHGNYLVMDFRTPRWVHPAQKPWWRDLTIRSGAFNKNLKSLGLHEAVRKTYYGIEVSMPNFYAIFELYCLTLRTFLTPINELLLALHEIWEVSNLPTGSLLCEEYISCVVELEELKKEDPALFETYR